MMVQGRMFKGLIVFLVIIFSGTVYAQQFFPGDLCCVTKQNLGWISGKTVEIQNVVDLTRTPIYSLPDSSNKQEYVRNCNSQEELTGFMYYVYERISGQVWFAHETWLLNEKDSEFGLSHEDHLMIFGRY